MIDEIIEDADERMQKSIESLNDQFKKIRTGRAHPSLLDQVKVSSYGSDMPLNQVANVNVLDARTLGITVWDKGNVAAVEKAIINSDLGLNPATSGTLIRIPLPPLTEERRRDLTKVVKQEAEGGRVSIRNIRRDANNDFKTLLKEKEISEDDDRRAQDQIQKLTDKYVAQIETMLGEKEKELMEI